MCLFPTSRQSLADDSSYSVRIRDNLYAPEWQRGERLFLKMNLCVYLWLESEGLPSPFPFSQSRGNSRCANWFSTCCAAPCGKVPLSLAHFPFPSDTYLQCLVIPTCLHLLAFFGFHNAIHAADSDSDADAGAEGKRKKEDKYRNA